MGTDWGLIQIRIACCLPSENCYHPSGCLQVLGQGFSNTSSRGFLGRLGQCIVFHQAPIRLQELLSLSQRARAHTSDSRILVTTEREVTQVSTGLISLPDMLPFPPMCQVV